MGKKKPAPRRKKRVADIEVSPKFFERPPIAAVEDSPPDIPEKLIPVLRKKPIVIGPERTKSGKRKAEPPAPRLVTSPIAAALRKRAAQNRGSKPKDVDAEVRLTADASPPAKIAALTPAIPAPEERKTTLQAPDHFRARGLGPVGFFGAALVMLAVCGIVVDASLPWLSVDADRTVGQGVAPNLESGTLFRGDLAAERAVNPYFDRLVGWPMIAYTFLIFTGLLLAGIDELQRVTIRAHRNMQVVLLAFASYLGFIIGLTGTRWLGLYVNALLDEGGTSVHLHVAPYLNLLLGVGVFAASARLLLRRWATMRLDHSRGYFAIEDVDEPKNFILASAAILLLLPLLPFASIDTDAGTSFVGEGELAAARNDPDSTLRPELATYGTLRAMVWLSLYFSIVALALGLLHRGTGHTFYLGGLVVALGILVLPVVIGLVAGLVFFGQLIAGPPTPSINWVPVFGFAGLGWLYYQFVRRIFMPYVSRAARERVEWS